MIAEMGEEDCLACDLLFREYEQQVTFQVEALAEYLQALVQPPTLRSIASEMRANAAESPEGRGCD
jgi:hypothetical protein